MKGYSLGRKSLLFVTGTRADFGKLEPLADAAVEAGHQVTFFVTGMHMFQKHGLTKLEVHRNGKCSVFEYINYREGDAQDIVFAKTVVGFSDYLKEMMPDLVVVHGDRVESFASAFVCATNYVPCAHVEGGEVSGTIDEIFRHCNTKLAWCHLVSSEEAKKRVMRLGERTDSIYIVGSPELDIHSQPSGVTMDMVRSRYEISSEDFGIVIFHPVTSEVAQMKSQASRLFSALKDSGKYFIVILPNNDPGHEHIQEAIDKLSKEQFRVLPSMRFSYFSELLRNASIVVGNSSVGVREAPFFGVPSLDIGSRQANRNISDSIKKCSAFDTESIIHLIESEWGKRYAPCSSFGIGNASKRFVDLLNSKTFWGLSMQKNFIE